MNNTPQDLSTAGGTRTAARISGHGVFPVTVAIVTYRSINELPYCLESLINSDIYLKIVIIDNNSPDDTFKLAEKYASRYENVTALNTHRNVGLAAANNEVIPFIDGDYVLILNPDTVVKPDSIAKMIEFMQKNQQVGVVGPKNLYENGMPHTSYHYGWSLWHLIVWRIFPYKYVRYLYDRYARYKESEVYFVSGACLLIKSDLFERIGGYDPSYFLTVEDACDLCRRVKSLGYSVVYYPEAEIFHLCGRSGAQVPYLTTLEGYKGSIYYFGKYYGSIGAWMAYIIVLFGCGIKLFISKLKALVLGKKIHKDNAGAYTKIFVNLLKSGPKISISNEH